MRFIRTFGIVLALALSSATAFADEATDPSTTMDKLYARLARTNFPDEATGILAEIESLRMRSGSDTADLLMSRAQKARGAAQTDLARQLYDAVVDLYPDWSRAWSERAAQKFQSGDRDGAMRDLAQTLKREPRDVEALTGVGAIFDEAGQPEAALAVYDRALKLAPAYEPLKEARARAQNQVWSRSP